MKIDLNDLSKKIYEGNKEKGFWPENPKDRNFGEQIALMTSELSEALEADRKGKSCNANLEEIDPRAYNFEEVFKEKVKDTKEDELADAIIRILDYCGANNVDITEHILLKLAYNSKRGYKHGKNY